MFRSRLPSSPIGGSQAVFKAHSLLDSAVSRRMGHAQVSPISPHCWLVGCDAPARRSKLLLRPREPPITGSRCRRSGPVSPIRDGSKPPRCPPWRQVVSCALGVTRSGGDCGFFCRRLWVRCRLFFCDMDFSRLTVWPVMSSSEQGSQSKAPEFPVAVVSPSCLPLLSDGSYEVLRNPCRVAVSVLFSVHRCRNSSQADHVIAAIGNLLLSKIAINTEYQSRYRVWGCSVANSCLAHQPLPRSVREAGESAAA